MGQYPNANENVILYSIQLIFPADPADLKQILAEPNPKNLRRSVSKNLRNSREI